MINKIHILILTPSYPGEGVQKADTPVVHYFVREWVKKGAEVRVVHYPVNFPKLFNYLAKPFRYIIESRLGSEIRTWNLDEREFMIDDVRVKRIPLVKYLPHARYSHNQINSAYHKTTDFLERENFAPDIISSHWINPQYELMHLLKKRYGCKTCYIAHDHGRDFVTIYRKEAEEYINETDIVGYRSAAIKNYLEEKFNFLNKPFFMCYSGIPVKCIGKVDRKIDNINTIIHVGTLLKRKHPVEIIPAVYKAFGNEDFKITYIGTGGETEKIREVSKKLGVEKRINLLGRLPREQVVYQMANHAVFIMISHAETFGLVYLEAMAQGCITIASRNEGFDGIIKDGENGFLCNAGDSDELAKILIKLKGMKKDEWHKISRAAIETAQTLTDEKTAEEYLNNLIKTL